MDINDILTKGLDLNDALDLLWPVSIYILGMAAYAIFVFKFYRFVAARDVFDLDLSSYEESSYRWIRSSLHFTLYGAKYLILFPVFAFFWFAVLTLVLAFLSKEQTFSDTLLIALATVQRDPSHILLQRGAIPRPGQDAALRSPRCIPHQCVILLRLRFP